MYMPQKCTLAMHQHLADFRELGWCSALVAQHLSMNADKYDGKSALEGKISLTPILMF
jgi:hypothetical protein